MTVAAALGLCATSIEMNKLMNSTRKILNCVEGFAGRQLIGFVVSWSCSGMQMPADLHVVMYVSIGEFA